MSGYYAALEKLKSGGKIGNPLDYILPDEWKPVVRDVMLDTIPVTSQQRSLARINQSGKEFADADNPISKALRAADIGLEGAGLASDFIPSLKAAGMALGSTLPFFLKGQKGLNVGKFGQGGMVTWHGSPHKFDKFDHSKMGTGEGAQAYGWGTYLAENPDVAGSYRKQLADDVFFKPDGTVFDPYSGFANEGLLNPNVRSALYKSNGNVDAAIDRANQVIDSIPNTQGAEYAASDLKVLQSLKDQGGISRDVGNLYKVDLPDDQIEMMLDWDAPLSEQPKQVQEALAQYDPDTYSPNGFDYDSMEYGQDSYMRLISDMGAEQASMKLKELGIPGIKYYDGSSRSVGEGTRNFVIFDENIPKILERNGGLL